MNDAEIIHKHDFSFFSHDDRVVSQINNNTLFVLQVFLKKYILT